VAPDRPHPAAYAFGTEEERERLIAVERALDGPSRQALLESGLEAGWRCWEVGAGHGSVARWLASQGCEVLATDLEQRFSEPGVRFLRNDVSADPAPGSDFDLVHARLLLEHLEDPLAAIRSLAGALREGGLLMVEDSAGLDFDAAPLARIASAWERAGHVVGWRAGYGRRLADDMRAVGLAGVAAREHRLTAPGGEAWLHVRAGLERLRPEILAAGASEEDLDAALRCLDDPATTITGPPVVTASGRRA
jgi:SAM-dependent methyltransferase